MSNRYSPHYFRNLFLACMILAAFLVMGTLLFNGCGVTPTPTPAITQSYNPDLCENAIKPSEFFDGESRWAMVKFLERPPGGLATMVNDTPDKRIRKALVFINRYDMSVLFYGYVCDGDVYLFIFNPDTQQYERQTNLTYQQKLNFKKYINDGKET